MASKAVTTPEAPGLPDLVQTRSEDFQFDARDIQPPRLKVASPTTGAAANGDVPVFSLFSQKGSDDADPVVLVEPVKDNKFKPGEGLKVYVLKMYKTKSANVNPNDWSVEQKDNGTLRSWQFDDPSAPPFARTQYNYVCYVPTSADADMPHNLLLGNTSTPTARFINTLLAQRLGEGHSLYTQPFELWPEKREREMGGQTNRWAIFKARAVQADADEVAVASSLLSLISTKPTNLDQEDPRGTTAAPAI